MAIDLDTIEYEDLGEIEDAWLDMAYEDRFISDSDLYGEEEF